MFRSWLVGRGRFATTVDKLRGGANRGLDSLQLTEADLEDPDLLGELGEVAGDVDFGGAPETGAAAAGGAVKAGGPEADGYDDDDEVVEPDRQSEEEPDEEDLLAMGDDGDVDFQEEVRGMMVRSLGSRREGWGLCLSLGTRFVSHATPLFRLAVERKRDQ